MFNINNEQWQIVLVDEFDKALRMPTGEYALGACNDVTKTIYIMDRLQGKVLEQVLCHELVHASMFAYDVILSFQEEELIAEIISIFGEEIINMTDIMLNKMERGRY